MRVRGGGCLAAAGAFLFLSSACFANDGPPPGAPPTSQPGVASDDQNAKEGCALHVWPAADAKSSFMGWFHGGAVDGDKRGIKGYPELHSDLLTTAVQHQLLQQVRWSSRLAASNLSVVVHDLPPVAQDDQERLTPLIADRPACYRELIVHSVFVERAALSATSVRVMVIAKTWRPRNGSPLTYTIMADERVNLASGDADAIKASLANGFIASVEKTLDSKYFHQPTEGNKE